MTITAQNKLNKLIHVLNEVRNSQLYWGHISDYRDTAKNAIADKLQSIVDQIDRDKYSMNRIDTQRLLDCYKDIDVTQSAAWHAQQLITHVYEAIENMAWCHHRPAGLPTEEDWKAAAEFVSFTQLAQDAVNDWTSSLK